MKKTLRLGLAAVAVLGLALGPAAVASADASATYTRSGIVRAIANWNSASDRLSIYDAYAEGWGARVRWETKAGGSGSLDTIGGVGTSATQTIGGVGQIHIKACSINNGNDVACSAYSAYSAG